MAVNTKISWAGDTWNPLRAVSKETGKIGWMCVLHGPGCLNCYAQNTNQNRFGNGLPFHADSLQKVNLVLSHKGQTSVDWPVRVKESRTIFLASMTDWMAPFYPTEWQSLLVGVMSLATQHTFITLTKRWENLFSMLQHIEKTNNRAIKVPADRAFLNAIVRANLSKGKYNLSKKIYIASDKDMAVTPPAKELQEAERYAELPWLPRNVIFGVSVCTSDEARRIAPMLKYVRGYFPEIKLAISQEPALDVINWGEILPAGTVDWIIWGGESGSEARPAGVRDWELLKSYGERTGTKVFFKQTGNVLARQLGLAASKGDDLNEANLVNAMRPIQQTIDMQGSLV